MGPIPTTLHVGGFTCAKARSTQRLDEPNGSIETGANDVSTAQQLNQSNGSVETGEGCPCRKAPPCLVVFLGDGRADHVPLCTPPNVDCFTCSTARSTQPIDRDQRTNNVSPAHRLNRPNGFRLTPEPTVFQLPNGSIPLDGSIDTSAALDRDLGSNKNAVLSCFSSVLSK